MNMDYSWLHDVAIAYFTGAVTVFLIFHRKILANVISLDSPQGNRTVVVDKVSQEFYNLLVANVDVSIYEKSTDAIELERQRIGSDIHDELAPHLSSLYLDLEVVVNSNDLLSPEAIKKLLDIRHKIRRTVVSLRKIIYNMLPVYLESQDFNHAIKELCSKHDGQKGTTILFRTTGQLKELTDQQKSYIFRIIQELINNSLKHSNAWTIMVSLIWGEQDLKVVIKDTGKGVNKIVKESGKYGVTGIFMRALIIGAVAKFNETEFGGMEFLLILPFERKLN